MNLTCFADVYRAAAILSYQGESLLLEGAGKTVAVRIAMFSEKKMLEVTELHVSPSRRTPRLFDFFSFRNEEFADLDVSPHFQKLLSTGD